MKAAVFAFLAGLMMLIGCTQNPVSPDGSIPAGNYTPQVFNYFSKQDTLFLLEVRCECVDSVLLREVMVLPFRYRMSGSELRIDIEVIKNFVQPGRELVIWERYRRVSGSTLKGFWLWEAIGFESSSPLSSEDSVAAQAEVDRAKNNRHAWIEISQADFILHRHASPSPGYASEFLKEWGDSLRNTYSIVLDSLDVNEVRLTGTVSLDTITISRNIVGDVIYKSSNPEHGSHVFYKDVTVCPNDRYPAWIREFLRENPLPEN